MPNRPIVGLKAFSSFVQQMREAYPDLHYDVGEVSVVFELAPNTLQVRICQRSALCRCFGGVPAWILGAASIF
jgi:hypothetical protein